MINIPWHHPQADIHGRAGLCPTHGVFFFGRKNNDYVLLGKTFFFFFSLLLYISFLPAKWWESWNHHQRINPGEEGLRDFFFFFGCTTCTSKLLGQGYINSSRLPIFHHFSSWSSISLAYSPRFVFLSFDFVVRKQTPVPNQNEIRKCTLVEIYCDLLYYIQLLSWIFAGYVRHQQQVLK